MNAERIVDVLKTECMQIFGQRKTVKGTIAKD